MSSKSIVVWINERVVEAVSREAIDAAPLETGGVLLGHTSQDHIVITALVGAGPRAIRSATRFEPDCLYQEQAIAEQYVLSGRMVKYLGDWHSHPSGSLVPSATDLATARSISLHRNARAREPLMVIASGSRMGDLAIWRLRHDRLGLRKRLDQVREVVFCRDID